MKKLTVKAVIITDGNKYLVHGCGEQDPATMFKAMSPLWAFDPSKETAHFIELEVSIPEFEKQDAPDV